ncbi:MAG: flavin reductase family protein, partial [Pseudomonadota bacterium]
MPHRARTKPGLKRSSNAPELLLHDVLPSHPIDKAAFRRLMGQFATGVCVISAEGSDGRFVGITVNSFVSISLEPLLV